MVELCAVPTTGTIPCYPARLSARRREWRMLRVRSGSPVRLPTKLYAEVRSRPSGSVTGSSYRQQRYDGWSVSNPSLEMLRDMDSVSVVGGRRDCHRGYQAARMVAGQRNVTIRRGR